MEGRKIDLTGLSSIEIERSEKKYGKNIISKQKRKGFLSQYLASFGDPIIKILLIALGINIIFMFKDANWYDSAGIAFALMVATLVSTISEYGSESAFEKLQQESGDINCRVKRNNILIPIPVSELVVGDLVLLQAGERVPADGHVVYGELLVDQSALNGESKEIRKTFNPAANSASLNLLSQSGLFAGSVVCEGDGAMIIDSVGDRTFYGKLAVEIQEDTITSPLRERLQKLATTISKMGYTAAGIIAVANLFFNFIIASHFDKTIILEKLSDFSFVFQTLINTITLAVTVIVMAVPEGLPMMITVVLSANMKKMLKDNVLVRKLVGIETAGSLNILFTDKTGTLTQGKLQVTTILSGDGKVYENLSSFKKTAPELLSQVALGCIYNTDSGISTEKNQASVIGGNATDRALLQYVLPLAKDSKNVSVISHMPFDSKNKYSYSAIKQNSCTKYLVKGAPEILLSHCRYYIDAFGNKKAFQRTTLNEKMNEMGNKAIRMLAIAEISSPIDFKRSNDLTLVGIIGIRDDIRREAAPAIAQITSAGVQTVMITGDNKETAVAIAKEIGLLKENDQNAIYTGQELAHMSDYDITQKITQLRVIARAMPTDKSRLVRLSQEMGLVAGMTGDGINDAPALKKSDVGFAMGSGTEVAKEAGDIVIVDNNISSIAKAILYGRTIFKSIRKFIIFQLTMNLSAVALCIICPFIGVDAPLTVLQMLWVNMIMDTLGGLAFAGEPALAEYMKEPPKKREQSIINRYMYSQVLFMGIYTTIMCLCFLNLPITRSVFGYGDGTDYFMTSFFALFIFAGVLNCFSARTYRINLLAHIVKNKMFIGIMICVTVIQVIIIYSGGSVFRTVGISPWHLQLTLLIAFSVIPADLTRKFILRKMGRKGYV